MEYSKLYTSHSKINQFPPNPNLFPKFYNCEEFIFVLEPGDMLYIPQTWFHWVFSYPDEKSSIDENLAITYTIYNPDNIDVFNEFYLGKPFVMTLDNKHHPFLDLSFSSILKNNNNIPKQRAFLTKQNTIVPVQKINNDNTIKKTLDFNQVFEIYNKHEYNISISLNSSLPEYLNVSIPQLIKNSFPNNNINTFFWLNLFKNKQTFVETGLHYDITHNILVQIKGKKVVRLYKPSDSKNLYLQPFYPK